MATMGGEWEAVTAADADFDPGLERKLIAGEAPALGRTRPWMAGFGNGGQRLWLMPEADIACVVFSGNYNAQEAWVSPTRIWREIVLANLSLQ